MTYEELKDFLQVRMRMSHVYQPLMIRELLTVGGRASTRQIAADIRDAFPVTPMHSLVIPRRHVATYFDLSRSEFNACDSLIKGQRDKIMAADSAVEGFNIGMNAGDVAGQTVFHCHIHLIPRRRGDVESARGGVRHVIPGKGHY